LSSVHIVTDSSCHIPAALCQELGIHVIPLPFTWDGETYLELVDMGPREFYARLRESPTLPTTSGPTPGAFLQVFNKLTYDGGKVLAIMVGSQFSSTYSSSVLAREELPDRSIILIDSDSNGLGLGFQVLAAARSLKAGGDLDAALNAREHARRHSGTLFSIADLDYLRRGGRIALVENMIGTFFRAAPLMEISGGPIKVIQRLRSSSSVIPRLIDQLEKHLTGGRPIRIGVFHADSEERGWKLMQIIQERIEPDELFLSELNPVLGIHGGPDTIGVGYCSGI
jgi:DegV family protein with EDD domain